MLAAQSWKMETSQQDFKWKKENIAAESGLWLKQCELSGNGFLPSNNMEVLMTKATNVKPCWELLHGRTVCHTILQIQKLQISLILFLV